MALFGLSGASLSLAQETNPATAAALADHTHSTPPTTSSENEKESSLFGMALDFLRPSRQNPAPVEERGTKPSSPTPPPSSVSPSVSPPVAPPPSNLPIFRAPAPAVVQTGKSLLQSTETPVEISSNLLPPIRPIDLITPPDDLWQRVRNGFSMPNLDNPLVADRQAWYLNRPEVLKSILNRSRRYLFYIVGELEKRGMPTELALLPMVESSYNPRAFSPAQASGLWQFIPSTGRNYHLEQNWWLDERRDIIASTGAALDYLQNIYEMHGDWHLALASYNWGEAAVGRAIAKNQAKNLPTDYAHINMPQETRYYVPKLQALKNIIARPELFGIRIDPIPNQPYFDTIDKTGPMDIALAAKLAEMPINEFLALNPSYNRPVMPASKDSPIVLPTDRVQTFLENLEQHKADEKPLSNWTTYTLKKGERLNKVAARFHITLSHLRQINGINARTRLRPGNTLLVPRKAVPQPAQLQENATLLANPVRLTGKPTSSSSRSAGKSRVAASATKGKSKSKLKAKPKAAKKTKALRSSKARPIQAKKNRRKR